MAQAVALPGQRVIDVIPPGELAEIGILTAVPVLEVQWFDERQTCARVHDYLSGRIEGRVEESRRCRGFAAGVCRGTGGAGMPCLFHEADGSPGWQRARAWEQVTLEDGSTALRRRP